MKSNLDVKAILDECIRAGLKGVKLDENGWRASTIYGSDKQGDVSLAISKEGAFKCFKSETSGSIVRLYSDLIGRDFSVAKAELRKKGLIPSTYSEVRTVITKKSELEEEEKEAKKESTVLKIRYDYIWNDCAKWRGLPLNVFDQAVAYGALGFIDSYPTLGSSYAFICNTPPIDGLTRDIKGVMLRSTSLEAKDKWRNPVNYPIWAPSWNPDATEVILTEGQWDALAMRSLLDQYSSTDDLKKFQVLALCGPKNVEKYPEVMEYMTDKKVYFVPDMDEKGEAILCQTSLKLEQVTREQRLLRVLGKPKDVDKWDLNEWYKRGISQDQFEMWMEGQDPFRVSNGYAIDSAFRAKHKLKTDAIIEVDDEGEPVEIYQGFKKDKLYLNREYLMDIFKPFPLLCEYIEEAHQSIESPTLFHAISFLTYEAGHCGRKFRFESGSAGCLFPNLFNLMVGPSGLGKSEAMKMLRPLSGKINPNLLTSENFSAESLVDEFKESPQRMLVTEEFAPWLKSREGSYRYSAMKSYLAMHGCESYSADHPYRFNFRKTGAILIDEPCFSILSACTTADIQNMNPDFLTDGVVGRFLYPAGMEKESHMPYTRKINSNIMSKVEIFFRVLNGTPIRTNCSMRMSASADLVYRAAFARQVENHSKADPLSDASTYNSRWKVNVFKHAILFELLRPQHEFEIDKMRNVFRFKRSDMAISEEAITASIKFVEVLNQSFNDNLLFQFRKSDSISFASKIQQRIIAYMKKHSADDGTGVARRPLLRFLQESLRESDAAIESLKAGGVLMEKEFKPQRDGKPWRGRPTMRYLLTENKNANNHRPIQNSATQSHPGSDSNNGQVNHSENHQGHSGNGNGSVAILGGLGSEHELRPSLGNPEVGDSGISDEKSD